MRFSNLNIRNKQSLVILITSGSALLLACALFVVYDVISFRRILEKDITILAKIIGANTSAALEFNDPAAARETLEALQANPLILGAAVYTPEGELLAGYPAHSPDSPETAPALTRGVEFTSHRMHLHHPIVHRGREIGSLFILSDLQILWDRQKNFVIIVTAMFVSSLFLAILVSRALQGLVLRPIFELAGVVRRVAREKNYGLRAKKTSGDELGQLIDGFNEMLDQIQLRDRDLETARNELEKRVEERTADLLATKEEAAREHARFKFIFDSVPIGIAWRNWDSPTMLVNPAHERITGVSGEESQVAGVFEKASHPDDYQRQRELAKDFVSGKIDHYTFEKRYLHKDGRVVWAQFSAHQFIEPKSGKRNRIATLVDITERKEAEEKLRQTEDLYRRAIRGVGAVPYVSSYFPRRYLFMGENIRDLIGYGPEEMGGDLWRKIILESHMAGEATGMTKEDASQATADGIIRDWRCDMKILTREGKVRWISDTSVQNYDNSGKAVGAMGILQDITERKKAEIATEIQSKLSLELSTSTSLDEAALIISRKSEELIGWDAFGFVLFLPGPENEKLLLTIDTTDGKKVVEKHDDERPRSDMCRLVETQGAQLILRDGNHPEQSPGIPFGDTARRSSSLLYVPVRFGGKTVGVMTIQSYAPNAYTQMDLATLQSLGDQCGGAFERIQAHEALLKSESQFRLVWNATDDGMRLATEQGVILMVNAAYARMTGLRKCELEGQPISIVEPEEKRTSVRKKFLARIKNREVRSQLEIKYTLWNGKTGWFEISDSLLEIPGQPTLLLTLFRDITKRQEARAELDTITQRLLESSRQAGMAEVATNVLHNVGNVLNSVNISANVVTDILYKSRSRGLSPAMELLRQNNGRLGDFLANDPKGQRLPDYLGHLAEQVNEERSLAMKELNTLRGNIDHIKEIVAMQQKYARVSSFRETVDLRDLIEDSLRMNGDSLMRHHVQVERVFEDVPTVTVEKHKVVQILVNLIRNAKQACDAGSRDPKIITIRLGATEKTARIAVADNGIGITREYLTRMFTHGFTTRQQGHGFGLHGSSIAAKEMDGNLTAQSDGPGHGAVFTLELPLNPSVT